MTTHVGSRRHDHVPGRATGRLYQRLRKAAADAALPSGATGAPVTEHDLEPLPPVVRRYLRFMGVLGRPQDWSFRVGFQGRFRTKPGGPWLPAEAWQYNCSPRRACS